MTLALLCWYWPLIANITSETASVSRHWNILWFQHTECAVFSECAVYMSWASTKAYLDLMRGIYRCVVSSGNHSTFKLTLDLWALTWVMSFLFCFNHCAVELFVSISYSLKAGFANAISSFKWRKNMFIDKKLFDGVNICHKLFYHFSGI